MKKIGDIKALSVKADLISKVTLRLWMELMYYDKNCAPTTQDDRVAPGMVFVTIKFPVNNRTPTNEPIYWQSYKGEPFKFSGVKQTRSSEERGAVVNEKQKWQRTQSGVGVEVAPWCNRGLLSEANFDKSNESFPKP